MRIGSLFSGYGGLDRGVQAVLGGEVAWHCEIEPGAVRLLEHRFPGMPNLGDISAVDWAEVEPVDVLTGGFPCQDVSSAGRRLGIRPGTRSGLWSHFAFAIDRLRPRLVLIENVRGLLSADAEAPPCDMEPCPWCVGEHADRPLRALGAVLGDLAGLGYDAQWCGVRAADAGAPHNRYRVFIAAWPAGDASDVVVERRGSLHRVGAGDQGSSRGAGGCAAVDPDRAAGGERGLAASGQAEGGRARADAGGRGGAPAADADRIRHEDWDAGQPRGAVALGGAPIADPASIGRGEGWPEPARLVRGSDAAVGSAAPADAVRDGREGCQERDLRPEAGQPASLGGDPAGCVLGAAGDGGIGPIASDAYNGVLPEVAAGADELDEQRAQGGRGAVEPAGSPRGGESAGGRAPGEPACGRGSSAGDATPPGLDWGPYEPAIRRWEHVLGRPAPAPTMTGKRGGQQLSPAFVEWMQGLPAGWVTDPAIGLSRNEQLKMLGNGVVPQQAELALRHLLATSRVLIEAVAA